MRACAALLALAAVLPPPAAALRAYGHAYSRPDDFSDDQIAAIASRFEVFTVEKSTATNKCESFPPVSFSSGIILTGSPGSPACCLPGPCAPATTLT